MRRRFGSPQPTLQARLIGPSLSLSLSLSLLLGFIITCTVSVSVVVTLILVLFFQVNKSVGPFDALLCVGQFFPDSPEQLDEFMGYVEGRSHIPLPTYFIGDYGVGAPKVLLAASKDSANRGFKMDGLRVCDNLFWLKGSGKFSFLGTFPNSTCSFFFLFKILVPQLRFY